MQRFSSCLFLLVLGSVILTPAQFTPAENLQQLIKDLALQKTYTELDQQAMRIAERLDQLTISALEDSQTLDEVKEHLHAVLTEEGRLELSRVIHLFRIPNGNRILVVYNLPMSPINASHKVVLRVWHPDRQAGNKGFLKPIQDVQGQFAAISFYPIRDIYCFTHQDELYVLLFGETSHGRGRRAASIWNIDNEECVGVKELDYGENCKLFVQNDWIALERELEEFGCEIRKMTEVYGWENDKFQLLSKWQNGSCLDLRGE